jgi:hypothetical protein
MLFGALTLLSVSSRAVVIEPFGTAARWSPFYDAAGATATLTSVPGVQGNALKLTYDLTVGAYAGALADLSARDVSTLGANGLHFAYRATGHAATLELKFADFDSTDTLHCDKRLYTLALSTDNAWHDVSVALASLALVADGNGVFDWSRVSRFTVGVSPTAGVGGDGTLWLDDVSFRAAASGSSAVDGFERANFTNDRPGFLGVYRGTGGVAGVTDSVVYVTTTVHAGTHALEMSYSIPVSGFTWMAEMLGGAPVLPSDRLEFWALGQIGGEPLKIELKSAGQSAKIALASYGSLTPNYQKFSIPFADFQTVNPSLNLGALTELVFVFENAGAGKIYLDDIAFAGAAGSTDDLYVVADFERDPAAEGYGVYTDTASSATLGYEKDATTPGATEDNRVGRLSYSLASGAGVLYAVAERELRPNLSAEPNLRFRFRGTGANATLEVKLADADGTEYVKKLFNVTNTGGAWKTATIPAAEFAFNAIGRDASLDLVRLATVTFAVSHGEAGPGTLEIDELETVLPPDFQKTDVGRVLTRVTTPDNPFSPNDDGVKDTARFRYNLSQTARVSLKIVDVRGLTVRTLDGGDQSAGDHALEWDGRRDDGGRVGNGIYFFVLKAEGTLDGTDIFRQVIGVVR